MRCNNRVPYTIKQGDNLYNIARQYQTTVPDILEMNPRLDPYNLKVGSTIMLCGDRITMQGIQNILTTAVCPNASKQIDLTDKMREAWEQHVYWTRMLLISIDDRLNDQKSVQTRLMQNPSDIANIFAGYYSSDIVAAIRNLLTEHLEIGAALITAMRDGKTSEADTLKERWYINANQIAKALSSINPYFNEQDLRRMLQSHLELTSKMVTNRLQGNYTADINAFNQVEDEILTMADYLTNGIMKQFPQRF